MESSDNEFGSYAPTTPLKPVAARASAKARSSAPPSKNASGAQKKRKRNQKTAADSVVGGNSSEGEQAIEPSDEDTALPVKRKTASGNKEEPAVNGTNKGKGKAKSTGKVEPPPKAKRKGKGAPETVDVSEVELVEDLNVLARNRRANAPATHLSKQKDTPKDSERLQEKCTELEAEKKELTKQVEVLTKLQKFDVEQASQQLVARYEAQLKAQETVVNDLTARLARIEPSTRSGKASILDFCSREFLEEEKRVFDREVTRLKSAAREKDAVVAKKDEKITELEQRVKELQNDLRIEIERSKSLTSKPAPPSTSKSRVVSAAAPEHPKHAEVVGFYEDLTNLLITNVKYQRGQYFDYEDCILTCIYTFLDTNRTSEVQQGKSLSFTLRLFYDVRDEDVTEVTSPEQLCKSVHYIPLELDKETPEFVEQLDYLNVPFTFKRYQLPLFMTQLYDKMEGDSGIKDESMEEDE